VKRYNIADESGVYEDPSGDLVWYDDAKAALDAKDRLYAAAWSECEAHRNYPDEDEMNTCDPENEAVNLINMAKLGTAMDDHDAARKEAGL